MVAGREAGFWPAGFAFRSTTGATADCELGAAGSFAAGAGAFAVEAGAAAGAAGAAAWRVTCACVTRDTVVVLGAGLVARVVRVRVVVVTAEDDGAVSVAVAAGLVSVVAGVASVAGGGAV